MSSRKIYVIGSLRNPAVTSISGKLRGLGYEVFDDWYAAGPEADDKWRDYEKERGRTYIEALVHGHAAEHVYSYDKYHLDTSDAAILVLPAGRSGHLELGYMIGRNCPSFILLDNPDRWDVMYKFADVVTQDEATLLSAVRAIAPVSKSSMGYSASAFNSLLRKGCR